MYYLFDSNKNPVPTHVVHYLHGQMPNASEQELQDYLTLLEMSLVEGETVVDYVEDEMLLLSVPDRERYAMDATRPDHVSPDEIMTCRVGPFTVFYHPTHSLDALDLSSNDHHQFTWKFYLGLSEDKDTIIEHPQWKAKGIRVRLLLFGEWVEWEQGFTLVVPNSRVRIQWGEEKEAEMMLPPDPTLNVVLLPQVKLPAGVRARVVNE